MLRLDHLTVIAPTLAEGVAHVRACLGLEPPPGGSHPEMGTHNHVMRLGDALYLEVVAVDPDAPAPAGPRWFGLGDAAAVRSDWERGRRLRGWVAGTVDIDLVLARHGSLLGDATWVSRGGNHSRFAVPPDGGLPLDGALPSVIERTGPPPAARMPDLGARLRGFVLEHPDPDRVAALYRDLGVDRGPELRAGPEIRYRALIDTPGGVRTLT
ncbi:MAG: VOC family protein [Thalassobaculum sp.]|uniref:VOC family protein n=1 Tax=Thalassobaculum sp. TaxID=2022740 RepID=UPI0032F05208